MVSLVVKGKFGKTSKSLKIMKLIVGFACSSLTVTKQKANARSPWAPCYFIFIHMFPWMNGFLFTKNNVLHCLIKREVIVSCIVFFKVFLP